MYILYILYILYTLYIVYIVYVLYMMYVVYILCCTCNMQTAISNSNVCMYVYVCMYGDYYTYTHYIHIYMTPDDPRVKPQTSFRFAIICDDKKNHGGGIAGKESWRINHAGGGNLGGVIMEASRRHLETVRSLPRAPTWHSESSRRHMEGSKKAPRRHPGDTHGWAPQGNRQGNIITL